MTQTPQPEPNPDIPVLTDLKIFSVVAILCIVAGLIIGGSCALLFDSVANPEIQGLHGAHLVGTQIPTEFGVLFILIMAATGLLIALTFKYVPSWFVKYYETREIPQLLAFVIIQFKDLVRKMDEKTDEMEKHDRK